MRYIIDRRALLKSSVLGIGLLALPGAAAAIAARGFSHGVASGEPRSDSVLLWTRYVGQEETSLRCEVSETVDFRRIVGGGDVVARSTSDYCAKYTVGGLRPGRWHYYRFIAPDGTQSDIGRTRTLPDGDVERFAIALFSCSNLPTGYFNAYGHAADRRDLDLVIHVGDYIYEYGSGAYREAVAGRRAEPDHDIVTLADYRLRYACYRADPDLQRLHQTFPMIAQWDDHEFANNAWMHGAENHDSTTQGDWEVRKAAAERAYREWLPVSDALYDSYQIGTLATLFKLETRVLGRMEQIDPAPVLARYPHDPAAAMRAFREGPWTDPSRTLMGVAQEQWLSTEFARSTARGTHWQIVAQQAVMGNLRMPIETEQWLSNNFPAKYRPAIDAMVAASHAGLPMSLDSWSGYPAARSRLLAASQAADADLVVLSGDSHNAWGHDLTEGGQRAGVEFAGQSVSSPGKDMLFPRTPALDVARAFRAVNPGLRFADTSRRGYVSLTIRPDGVTGEWHFMQDVAARSTIVADTHRMLVRKGHRRLMDV